MSDTYIRTLNIIASLARCPFCGSEPEIKDYGRRTTGHGESVREMAIVCQCGISVKFGGRDLDETSADAANVFAAWNTRVKT